MLGLPTTGTGPMTNGPMTQSASRYLPMYSGSNGLIRSSCQTRWDWRCSVSMAQAWQMCRQWQMMAGLSMDGPRPSGQELHQGPGVLTTGSRAASRRRRRFCHAGALHCGRCARGLPGRSQIVRGIQGSTLPSALFWAMQVRGRRGPSTMALAGLAVRLRSP